jgi:hypothetical protein
MGLNIAMKYVVRRGQAILDKYYSQTDESVLYHIGSHMFWFPRVDWRHLDVCSPKCVQPQTRSSVWWQTVLPTCVKLSSLQHGSKRPCELGEIYRRTINRPGREGQMHPSIGWYVNGVCVWLMWPGTDRVTCVPTKITEGLDKILAARTR